MRIVLRSQREADRSLHRIPRIEVAWTSRLADFPENLLAALSRSPRNIHGNFSIPLRGGAMRPRSLALSACVHAAALVILSMAAALWAPLPPTREEIARMRQQRLTW